MAGGRAVSVLRRLVLGAATGGGGGPTVPGERRRRLAETQGWARRHAAPPEIGGRDRIRRAWVGGIPDGSPLRPAHEVKDRFAACEPQRCSAGVGGDPGGRAEGTQPDAKRLDGAPAVVADIRTRWRSLMRERREVPQQGVAAEVVHGSAPGRGWPSSSIRCSTTASAL